jgi:hypothetical protein
MTMEKRRRTNTTSFRKIYDIPELFSLVCSYILFDETTVKKWNCICRNFVDEYVPVEHVTISNYRWVERAPIKLPSHAKQLWIYLKSPTPSIEVVNDDINELLKWMGSIHEPLSHVHIISDGVENISLYVAISLAHSKSVCVTLNHDIQGGEERSFLIRSFLSCDLRELNGRRIEFATSDIQVNKSGSLTASRKLESGVSFSVTRKWNCTFRFSSKHKVKNDQLFIRFRAVNPGICA